MLPPRRHLSSFGPAPEGADAREQEWAARIRVGDETAFESLMAAMYAQLCDYAYSFLKSRDASEDAVQEVFVWLWEHRAKWDVDSPRAYLYHAVRNRILNRQRREQVHERWKARVLAEDDVPEETTLAGVEYDELAQAVREAIDALPERCQLIFKMSRDQGLKHAEIASALGLSPKTVDAQIARAFRLIRARVAPYLTILIAVTGAAEIAEGLVGRLFR